MSFTVIGGCQLYEWTNKETVYVCQGEASVEVVETLELAATTCLGGPVKASFSDWSPLKGKHVVVLRHLNSKGRDYGEKVSQLCLGAGARSSRIVVLPELQEDETVAKWLTERRENDPGETKPDLVLVIATRRTRGESRREFSCSRPGMRHSSDARFRRSHGSIVGSLNKQYKSFLAGVSILAARHTTGIQGANEK